jgi:hypothetical protein
LNHTGASFVAAFTVGFLHRPSTFSGQRALNFVLDNRSLIDKTLLINVKVVRIDKNYAARGGSFSSSTLLREGKT